MIAALRKWLWANVLLNLVRVGTTLASRGETFKYGIGKYKGGNVGLVSRGSVGRMNETGRDVGEAEREVTNLQRRAHSKIGNETCMRLHCGFALVSERHGHGNRTVLCVVGTKK